MNIFEDANPRTLRDLLGEIHLVTGITDSPDIEAENGAPA